MIPLIQSEIASNGWMTTSEFANIIAIAEMTPGPIAVNSATFVGYKTAGILGGFVATIGVTIPSLMIILLISKYFFKFQKHPINTMVFYGIRPVIVALITIAAIYVGETTFLNYPISNIDIFDFLSNPLQVVNLSGILIFIGVLLAVAKFKVNPMVVILGSGVLGVVLFYLV
ncbi:Chromate transport protein [Caldisalinibacter kiritimatiensis]|uniref:Chromate transport protein n=2 Tax=Caldisalinibacter kiritimatiensis TaxID=1304284 RepID=R1ATZ5_9FIRM|nr:Chromate transport protein [Caldisalinibacter kiritimatiensis]